MNVIKNAQGVLKSETIGDYTKNMSRYAIEALMKDPIAALDFVNGLKSLPSIRDQIFFECFKTFLLNSCEYDIARQEFVENNLSSFVVALAEASPNSEAGYDGDGEKLAEYAMRIIKVIDDCGTIQKSYYLACLARAVRAKYISSAEFFKLSFCIRSLTEEDLFFIRENISQDIISIDAEFIDDFRALGLLKDVDGGFSYTKRAFMLVKYALDYEGNRVLPDLYPDRLVPKEHENISGDDINRLFDENNHKIINQAVELSTPKWNQF